MPIPRKSGTSGSTSRSAPSEVTSRGRRFRRLRTTTARPSTVSKRVRVLWLALALLLACACSGPGARQVAGSVDQPSRPAAPRVATLGLDEDLRNLWNVVTDAGGGGEGQ